MIEDKGTLNDVGAADRSAQPVEANAVSGGDDGAKILTTITTEGPAQQEVAIPNVLPLLAVRNTVGFPGTVMPLNIGREPSKLAVSAALSGNKLIGIVTQRNPDTEHPGPEDLYSWGTVGVVLKLLRMPGGDQTIVVHGLLRFQIVQFLQAKPYMTGRIEVFGDSKAPEEDTELQAMTHNIRNMANRVIDLSDNMPDEAQVVLSNITHSGALADFLAANLNLSISEKQDILETVNIKHRLEKVSTALAEQLDVLELSTKIQKQVKDSIGKTQRQYFLREQLEAIQKELGEFDQRGGELDDLRKRVAGAKMPPEVEKEAIREIDRMAKIPTMSPEYSVARDYVEWFCVLPWSKSTEDQLDIRQARKILDKDHYDLEKVKKRIVEFLAVRKLKPKGRGPILCFVGPPGVGKTSLGRSIARSMGRNFVRMSLGGIRDEAEIRGHRRTYIGAIPGRIIQELRKTGCNNPVFMLDEVDKIGQDFRGDPASALLEVLDPEQNFSFVDHYMDVPFDLSKVMFIATGNYMAPVPPALRDRMEVIEIPGYTQRDKLQIARRFLVPRQIEENGLDKSNVSFTDEAINLIIESYTREAGVRNLEREIGNICRAIAAKVVAKAKRRFNITARSVARYLGPTKFEQEMITRTQVPGVATGLAYTPFGGEIIFVEATSMPGKGNLQLTGQIGDVMKESAQAAFSLLRSRAKKLKLDPDEFARKDFHLHVPAGAVPKDGPSAGTAMFTALVSLETGIPVKSDVAMTGEITLRGLILPIGGIKEKILAAKRAGVKHVIVPRQNQKDLVDIPKDARKGLKFSFARTADQVLRIALTKPIH